MPNNWHTIERRCVEIKDENDPRSRGLASNINGDSAIIIKVLLFDYPTAIAVRDIVIAAVRLSVRPSVTLSCLRYNLSKHGWIGIIFCMWLVIIIILDGFVHGNI